MPRRLLHGLLLVLSLFSLLANTAPHNTYTYPSSADSTGTDKKIFLPLIMDGLETIVSPQTIVLPPNTLASLANITPDGVFIFKPGTSGLENVSSGNIIVGDVSAACPQGFLRKVIAVTYQGGSTYVQTGPASLEDAIQQGVVQFTRPLTADNIESASFEPGVTLLESPKDNSTAYLNFQINDVVLYDQDGDRSTTGDQVRADGNLHLSPALDFSLQIKDHHLNEAMFAVNLAETTELKLKSETELASLQASYKLGNLRIAAFTVMEGPVPLVFTVEMPIYLKADGSVRIGVTTSVTQSATLKAGLHYQKGTWTPIREFTSQFSYDPPHLSTSMELKGYVSAPLTLKLYGVPGPYGEVSPYLKLEADTSSDPWWTLKGGIDVNIGFNLGVFGDSKEDHSARIIGYEIILSEPPSQPNPANTTAQVNPALTLYWELDAIDKSNLVYDIYLEPDDPSPDVQIADNQAGTIANPGVLQTNTTYYWQVIAINSLSLEMKGPVWSFTTDDGAIIPGQMVYIPAGTFQMGCNLNRPGIGFSGCPEDQLPLHSVYLDAYYMDQYEVTNGQYRQCVADGACILHLTDTMNHENYATDPAYSNYPVISVTWSDAISYCTWAGKRLPTEAEWEKAARGPAGNVFSWGDELPDCTYSNLALRNQYDYPYCVEDTVRIGSYAKDVSGYGVVDMTGNVSEIVNDWYQFDYYSYSPPVNPQGPDDSNGHNHVVRGGSWALHAGCARNAKRYCEPTITEWSSTGFRCAASVEP